MLLLLTLMTGAPEAPALRRWPDGRCVADDLRFAFPELPPTPDCTGPWVDAPVLEDALLLLSDAEPSEREAARTRLVERKESAPRDGRLLWILALEAELDGSEAAPFLYLQAAQRSHRGAPLLELAATLRTMEATRPTRATFTDYQRCIVSELLVFEPSTAQLLGLYPALMPRDQATFHSSLLPAQLECVPIRAVEPRECGEAPDGRPNMPAFTERSCFEAEVTLTGERLPLTLWADTQESPLALALTTEDTLCVQASSNPSGELWIHEGIPREQVRRLGSRELGSYCAVAG
ncbi:MAG: hypothetical protein VX899_10945 [Myxococcota bacterium]|nr:hypothetical protein [Myxococcota bacterium]